MLDAVTNFAKAAVSTGYNSAATSIVLATGTGSLFPTPSIDGDFNLVWWNISDYNDPSDDPDKEIVRCTARTGDTLTVIRAQEGTAATNKNIALKTYEMILTPTAKMITDIQSQDTTLQNELNAVAFPSPTTTGEAIDGSVTPQAVCIKVSDGKIYKAQANDTTRTGFIGFITTNAGNGSAPAVTVTGTVSGFSGLTPGDFYYVDVTAGAIVTPSPSSARVVVGFAVSATQLLITKLDQVPSFTNGVGSKNLADASGSLNIAHGLGVVPKFVRITAFNILSNGSGGAGWRGWMSVGSYNGSTVATVYAGAAGGGSDNATTTDTTNLVYIVTDEGNGYYQKAAPSIDATNITLTWTKNGSPTGTVYYMWEAYA